MSDAAREAGRGALSSGVEQPFRGELLLERLEASSQFAFAGFLEVVGHELEFAARFVETHAGPEQHLHAVAGREAYGEVPLAEHGAAHLGVFVLQREIPVAGRRAREIRKLARDPERRQRAFQEATGLAVQAADRINVAQRVHITMLSELFT